MQRIVIIGGSGHVGSYLIPALVEGGYEVVNVSRGVAKPYRHISPRIGLNTSRLTASPKKKQANSAQRLRR